MPTAPCNAIDAVMAEMHRTDELMSTYKPASQLSQVNAHAYERPVQVDADIIDVVDEGARVLAAQRRRLRHHLRERRLPLRLPRAPASDRRRRSRPRCPAWTIASSRSIREARTIRFLKPGMRIDLGGIAKG